MFNWLKKSVGRSGGGRGAENQADPASLMAQATEALNAGDREKAAQCYQQAVLLDPNNPALRVGLGVALIRQASYAEAKTHLNRAILLDPANPSIYYLLGNIAQKQGDLPAAIELYNEALELKSNFEAAFNDLAAVHLAAGDKDSAEEVLSQAVMACDQSALLNFELGVVYANKNNFAKAVECYQRALLIKPAFGEAHRNLGVALQSQGKVAEAIASFERALSAEPGHLAAHSNLLWVLSFADDKRGRRYLPEARRYGAKVLALARPYGEWPNNGGTEMQEGLRRLRVGLVSGDLWTHPVGIFLEGVLGKMGQEKANHPAE